MAAFAHTHGLVPASATARLGRMRVQVNGEPRELPAGSTIAALLGALGLGDRPVAVERNAEIVPRAQHANTQLADGDALEVVQFVGGG
jgi:sulfur carrier protein